MVTEPADRPAATHDIALSFTIALPDWVSSVALDAPLDAPTDRMAFVLDLARRNVGTGGGPFAAAVFRADDHALISIGLNRVVAAHVPIAHAEIVAIALAGQKLGRFDLSADGPIELVTSCEPCAMCLGAIPWSGISRVVAGARDGDARAVGFDEGAKPDDWAALLTDRGLEVLVDVCRDEAAAVLASYGALGGRIYNGISAGVPDA